MLYDLIKTPLFPCIHNAFLCESYSSTERDVCVASSSGKSCGQGGGARLELLLGRAFWDMAGAGVFVEYGYFGILLVTYTGQLLDPHFAFTEPHPISADFPTVSEICLFDENDNVRGVLPSQETFIP